MKNMETIIKIETMMADITRQTSERVKHYRVPNSR